MFGARVVAAAPLATVIGAGVSAAWAYKRNQILIVHPGVWPLYPLSDLAPYLFLWPLLFVSVWVFGFRFLNHLTNTPAIPAKVATAAPFLPFFFLPWVSADSPAPALFQAAVGVAFLLLAFAFLAAGWRRVPLVGWLRSEGFRDSALLAVCQVLLWQNPFARVSMVRAAGYYVRDILQLANQFQYPAWNPLLYCGSVPYIYTPVDQGFLWPWILGFMGLGAFSADLQGTYYWSLWLADYLFVVIGPVGLYWMLRISFQLGRFPAFTAATLYTLNYYMQAITGSEVFHFFPYLIFPWVFLLAERCLRSGRLALAAAAGALYQAPLAFFHAYPENMLVYYYLLALFFLYCCVFPIRAGRESARWDFFPLVAGVVFMGSHLLLAFFYFQMFDFALHFPESLNSSSFREISLTQGYGAFAPFFYPYFVGPAVAFLCITALLTRGHFEPREPQVRMVRFVVIVLVFMVICTLGDKTPLPDLLKTRTGRFPFTRYWFRFGHGLYFCHYVLAAIGLHSLLGGLQGPQRNRYRLVGLIALLLTCVTFVLGLMALPGLETWRVHEHRLVIGGYDGGDRELTFFVPYLWLAVAAGATLLLLPASVSTRWRYVTLASFFFLTAIPLIHYMEPRLRLTEAQSLFKVHLPFWTGLRRDVPPIRFDRAVAAYMTRDPHDRQITRALAEDRASPDDAPATEPWVWLLPETPFSRYVHVDAASNGLRLNTFSPLAGLLFNATGNEARPATWRWLPRFDAFFSAQNENESWFMTSTSIVESPWIVDFLGIETLLMKADDHRRLAGVQPFSKYRVRHTLTEGEREVVVLHNPGALPFMRMYTAAQVQVAPSGHRYDGLNAENFRDRLFVAGPMRPLTNQVVGGGESRVEILEVKGNWAIARTHAGAGGSWLGVTDYHHPAWRARVDGEPAPVERANLAFKAVPVPAGDHLVWLEFRPLSLWVGAFVSALALLALAASLGRYPSRRLAEFPNSRPSLR